MTTTFLSRFLKQLGRWIIHGFVNALPSLTLLTVFIGPPDRSTLLAVGLAIGVCAMGFALHTSINHSTEVRSTMWHRALKLGLRIRLIWILLSLLQILAGLWLFVPDLWFGLVAASAHEKVVRTAGLGSSALSLPGAESYGGFYPVFCTSLLTGLIICFFILTLSFFCLIILQARKRRSFLRSLAEQNAR